MDHSNHRQTEPVNTADPYDRFAVEPHATAPRPPVEATPPAGKGHPGHSWRMHLLMCAPMLLIVGYLVITGAAGAGAIGYALLCMVMMGAMMLFMNHGGRSGHRH